MKKLYRSDTDKVFAGILGGIGEYLQIDSTILRILFVLFVIVTGFFPGVLFYLVAIFLIPIKTVIEPVSTTAHATHSTEHKSNHEDPA